MDVTVLPRQHLETEEQVKNYLLKLIGQVEALRRDIDGSAISQTTTVPQLKNNFNQLSMRYGGVVFAAELAYLTRQISQVLYQDIRQRALQAVAPRVVSG